MEDESERAEMNKRYSGQAVAEIFKYTWDQTDQYVRVYVDIPSGVMREHAECEFPPDPEHPEDKGKHQSFSLRVKGNDGRTYTLKRKVLRPIDVHEFGEINTATIHPTKLNKSRGVDYGGCRLVVEDKRVIVHMTKYFMIVSDGDREEYREMAEKGMMGPMASMHREDEVRHMPTRFASSRNLMGFFCKAKGAAGWFWTGSDVGWDVGHAGASLLPAAAEEDLPPGR